MCGRFAFFQEIDPLLDDLDAADLTDGSLPARWNIPPTTPIHVVTESVDKNSGEVLRALRVARWGLLPPFAKDLTFSSRTFNARSEDIATKPSFRGALGRYRAIVPISGYFEWKRQDASTRKQPYFITDPGGGTIYLAALVSWWKGPGGHDGPAASADGTWLLSATIITRAATGTLAGIHDRTPVMLDRAHVDAYLDTGMSNRDEVQQWLLDETNIRSGEDLELRPVPPAVGNTRAQGPELIARAEPLF